jgi:hypothetical protein
MKAMQVCPTARVVSTSKHQTGFLKFDTEDLTKSTLQQVIN